MCSPSLQIKGGQHTACQAKISQLVQSQKQSFMFTVYFINFFFIKLTAYVLRVRCYCWHLHFTKHSPLITMYMQVHFKLVLIYHNYLFCWSIIAFIFGLQLHDNFKSFFMIVWTKTIIDECNWQKEPNKRRQLFRKKPLLITI